MAPDDAEPLVLLTYRQQMLEEAVKDLRTTVESRFTQLGGQVATLGFVSKEVYERDRENDRKQAEETRAIATAARTASVAVLMLLASLILAVGVGIFRAVTG
jgi:hypothetical protein